MVPESYYKEHMDILSGNDILLNKRNKINYGVIDKIYFNDTYMNLLTNFSKNELNKSMVIY